MTSGEAKHSGARGHAETPPDIRPARPEEAPAVVDLLLAQLREHAIETPRAGVEAAVAGVFADPSRGRLFVVRRKAEPERLVGVAYVSFVWALEHGGQAAWLEELYIEPALRGAGLGSALLEVVLDAARAAGCAAVDLEVEADHDRAEHLYQRAGFRRHSRARWVKAL